MQDTASADTEWDYLAMLPLHWGWAVWHPAVGATTTTEIFVDYDGLVYSNSIADGLNSRSGGLYACGSQRIVLVADAAHGVAVTGDNVALNVNINVIPRYALWA
jgi:hypothetical protein